MSQHANKQLTCFNLSNMKMLGNSVSVLYFIFKGESDIEKQRFVILKNLANARLNLHKMHKMVPLIGTTKMHSIT